MTAPHPRNHPFLPPELSKESAGEPYRPSNGTEGMMFEARWCETCRKWRDNPDAKTQCQIAWRAGGYMPGDKLFPKQWRHAPDGSGPECTSWRPRKSARLKMRAHLPPPKGGLFG